MHYERNSKGEVRVDGKLVATVPTDRSMLSLFGQVRQEGDEFRSDFFVYRDGNRIRRWFETDASSNLRIWPPNLKDIGRIERLFVKTSKKRAEAWAEFWAILKRASKTLKTDEIVTKDGRSFRLGKYSMSLGASTEKKSNKHYALAEKVDQAHRRYKIYERRTSVVVAFFLRSARQIFDAESRKRKNVVPDFRPTPLAASLTVNGNTYWFERHHMKNGVTEWTLTFKENWPIEVKL